MTSMTLDSRSHPLFAWLLLALALLVAVFFVIIPAVMHSQQLSEQIESGYQRLYKMRQVAAAAPELASEYERVQQQGLDTLFYPQGMTAAQVGKELQGQVANVVRTRNGTLFSSEVLEQNVSAEEQQTDYERVTVQVIFQGDMELLRQVLHEAYVSRPLIFVEGLEVRPVDNQLDKAQQIRASVKISTYWRARGS